MEILHVTPSKDLQTGKTLPETNLVLGLKVCVIVVNDKGRFPVSIDNITISGNLLTIEI